MTSDVPSNPSVLNTTVLSNFSSIDRIDLLVSLTGICTVPVVQAELEDGVGDHPFLGPAVNAVGEVIPVAPISETVANRDAVTRGYLDPGESQAYALADVHDGRLLTDDGDARQFAKEQGVSVVGSIGVLLAAIDAEKIDEATANNWLQTWVDDFGYRVPYLVP
jgi:predicted nucleic acid-binding protein